MPTGRVPGENRFAQANQSLKSNTKPKKEAAINTPEKEKTVDTKVLEEKEAQKRSDNSNIILVPSKEPKEKKDITSLFPRKDEKFAGHTLYLNNGYYNILKKLAKNQGISVSNVVNEILKDFIDTYDID